MHYDDVKVATKWKTLMRLIFTMGRVAPPEESFVSEHDILWPEGEIHREGVKRWNALLIHTDIAGIFID